MRHAAAVAVPPTRPRTSTGGAILAKPKAATAAAAQRPAGAHRSGGGGGGPPPAAVARFGFTRLPADLQVRSWVVLLLLLLQMRQSSRVRALNDALPAQQLVLQYLSCAEWTVVRQCNRLFRDGIAACARIVMYSTTGVPPPWAGAVLPVHYATVAMVRCAEADPALRCRVVHWAVGFPGVLGCACLSLYARALVCVATAWFLFCLTARPARAASPGTIPAQAAAP